MITFRPRLLRIFATISLISALLFSPTLKVIAGDQPKISGTYSDLRFNEEGGDLLGTEIRIVPVQGGYEGVLQIAEGAPGSLILVKIHANDNRIDFAVPDESMYAGTFSGVVANGALTGTFKFKSGGNDKVVLKKGRSYWD